VRALGVQVPGTTTASAASLFTLWLESTAHPQHSNVHCLAEKPGSRSGVLDQVCDAVEDHLIGASILGRLDFPVAAAIVDGKLPRGKRIRSGDLAEIVATEYVQAHTEFDVPLKRLRHKDDREMAMRGDDIIGLRRSSTGPRVLKGEVKSRANLAEGVVGEACTALAKHQGRPNPATLAFIAVELRRADHDADAERVEDLMLKPLRTRDVSHFVFTMSGNDASARLAAHAAAPAGSPERHLVGLVVADHQAFISSVFDRVIARHVVNLSTTSVLSVVGGAQPDDPRDAADGGGPASVAAGSALRGLRTLPPTVTTSAAIPVSVTFGPGLMTSSLSNDDPDN
jgi:hypothetical protein